MGTGMGTIRRHKQFLKNYNMVQQIGHQYDTGMAPQMKCLCILDIKA